MNRDNSDANLAPTSHQVDIPVLTDLDQLLGFCQFNLLEINVFIPAVASQRSMLIPVQPSFVTLITKGATGLIYPSSGASPRRRHSRQQVKAADRAERNACWRSNVYWSSYE